MSKLLTPLEFTRGRPMKNRFMLAPLTNWQSHEDGTLSDEEFHWLTKRAEGGFGLTMTCAAHVQEIGKGFPGQLGAFGDQHIKGLSRLAEAIKAKGSIANAQLHHAGMRSPEDIIGQAPVSASADEETGARELSTDEVRQLRDDFIAAAVRCDQAGYDGVELHGAHGYILCQFFSEETNRREDEYGGSLENRYRILEEIIDGVRHNCRPDLQLGVRLSPERFGIKTNETLEMAARYLNDDRLDFLDMSLWDAFKEPVDEAFAGNSLLELFAGLERGQVKLGVAGNIRTPQDADRAMNHHIDWIMLGRAAILQHDFPNRYAADAEFTPVALPVTRDYLVNEGLSKKFIDYMDSWPGFIAEA
ncbi:MAG: 2,4-dienoyl-CoA reductase-like NADH-dependent reductase (Old Yellow Enzyme family) [Candidatus Azotimanducaceae bacterium]|jgi:2,4-dienoyl-CoA reductase-like NADH-dependent reductase (Old Yellow Enzyme family)